MIYNNQCIGLGKIVAYFNDYIQITSKDGKKEIYLNFNRENYNFRDMKSNQKLDLIKYLHWDTTLKTEETFYLFDITKDKIYLTKLGDNKYRIEIDIENPSMIYCPLGENKTFYNLKVDAEFSFIYDVKLNK